MSLTDDFDENDVPKLDASTLALLQEFYTERDEREKHFEELKSRAQDDFDNHGEKSKNPLSMSLFAESWQDSQFWYKDETATVLAEQLLEGVTAESRLVVVSAPSVYIQLRNLLNDGKRYPQRPKLMLLEFDERFGVFKDDFSFYDFKQPLKLDPSLKGSFDRIICDPPFLSEDCQSKAALTVRWLAKSWHPSNLKLILCTGERMETLAHKLYGKAGMRTTTFHPEHSKGLSNEFRCYANFEGEAWRFEAEG